jgi:hypothetical protein
MFDLGNTLANPLLGAVAHWVGYTAMFSTSGSAYSTQQAPQLVTVAKVTPQLGRVLIDLESGPGANWAAPVRAYRVGRNFRHFGHNAPPNVTTPIPSSGTITGSSTAKTSFVRNIDSSTSMRPSSGASMSSSAAPMSSAATPISSSATPMSSSTVSMASSAASINDLAVLVLGFDDQYTALAGQEMPLDIEAPDLAAGRRVIVLGATASTGGSGGAVRQSRNDRRRARPHRAMGQPRRGLDGADAGHPVDRQRQRAQRESRHPRAAFPRDHEPRA